MPDDGGMTGTDAYLSELQALRSKLIAGDSVTEVTIRGRRVRYANPAQMLDWVNIEIDREESRLCLATAGPARNRVRLRR